LAISPTLHDDFQDGTIQNWGSGAGSTVSTNVADAGPGGTGDNALDVAASNRFVVINSTQWTGDWTAAGVSTIALDVLNTSNFDLNLRLAIAGPGGFSSGGMGDTYATDAVAVAVGSGWQSVEFDATAAGFSSVFGSDLAVALADVLQLRILHSAALSFVGDEGGGSMQLDNIRAVPEPATLALMAVGLTMLGVIRHRR
jgi:hypothetical protein